MPRPDHRHVDGTVTAIVALARPMASRLTAQLQRDARGGSALPDGYPAGTLGGGGGSEDTSTERAAIARIGDAQHPPPDDEHHRLTWAAWHKLEAVVVELRLIDSWLARLEAAGTPAVAANDGTWCENHLRHDKGCVPTLRRQLCSWCYGIQADYGMLPSAALIDRHDRGERLSQAAVEVALGVRRAKASA